MNRLIIFGKLLKLLTFTFIFIPLHIYAQGSYQTSLWYDGTDYQNKWNTNLYAFNSGTELLEERCDSAYFFDGVSDYITTGSDAIGTSDFSISLWIKTKNTDVTLLDSYYNNDGLELRLVDGKPVFFMKTSGNYSYINHYATAYVADNKWHHVLVSVNRDLSNGIRIFVDGVQRGSGNPTSQNGNLPSALMHIGTANYWIAPNKPYVEGVMDNIKIFHQTMTPDDVMATESCPLTPFEDISTHLNGDDFIDKVSGGSATNHNGTEIYPNGRCGSAYKFDGVDDRLTHNIDGPGAGDFTISLWVQTEDTHASLMDTYYGPGFQLRLDNGKPRFTLYAPGNSYSTAITSSVSVADGEWHHIMVSIDRDNPTGIQIYVDGIATATGNPTNQTGVLVPNTMIIGAAKFWPAPNHPYFDGLMDDIKIFHTIRTPEELMETETCPLEAEGNTLNHYNGNNYINQITHHTATDHNGVIFADGRCDSAYYFSGNDEYLTTELEGPGTGDFTLSFWFKDVFSAPYVTEKDVILLDSYYNGNGFIVKTIGGKIAFKMYAYDSTYVYESFIAGITDVTDFKWHHIMISVDRDNADGIRVYVDGTLEATGNPTNQQGPLTTDTLFMGTARYWPAPNRPFFKGYMDDIKSFTTALTPYEVDRAETCSSGYTGYTCDPFIDLMIVHDLSNTMNNPFINLKQQTLHLFDVLTSKSTNSKIGFSGFVDIPVLPLGSTYDTLYTTYQSLTADASSFYNILNPIQVGGGGDYYEAAFDGMLHAARRTAEVGYRVGSHRNMILITDTESHIYGDCVDNNLCSNYNNGDGVIDVSEGYVSLEQLAQALIDEDITPTFVVPSNFISYYENVMDNLETLGVSPGKVIEFDYYNPQIADKILEGACEVIAVP